MAAFEGLVTVGANVSQETRDKAFGAQGGSKTIADLVDSIMLNSADEETFLIQFASGKVVRLKDTGLAKVEALAVAEGLSQPVEAFSVLAEDAGMRSPRWLIANRVRTITTTGGTAGVSDIIDPTIPGTSLPTIINRLESAGVALVLFVSQKPAALNTVAGGVGVVAVLPGADWDVLFAPDAAPEDPEIHDAACETFIVARSEEAGAGLRDQVFE